MKIYNEVTIDMNPESSNYRNHLSEDSFEYDGPMALCTNLHTDLSYPGGGKYYNHTDHDGFWIVETRPADLQSGMDDAVAWLGDFISGEDTSSQYQYHIVVKEGPIIIESYPSIAGSDSGMTYSQALESGTTVYNDYSAMESGGEGYGLETAEEVAFGDWSPYFDEAGNIKEGQVENFQEFLAGIDDYFSKDNIKHSTFKALVSTIPKDIIPKKESVEKARGTYFENLQAATDRAASARKQKMSQMSQQGVYSAIADESSLHSYYQPLSGMIGQEALQYGASQESTQRLLDWISDTADTEGDEYVEYDATQQGDVSDYVSVAKLIS